MINKVLEPITVCCVACRSRMKTPACHWKRPQSACEHQNWTIEQWENVAWSDEPHFFLYIMWTARCVYVIYLGKRKHLDAQPIEALPLNFQELKNMLQMSWCQIPEDIFTGLEEKPRWVRAALVAEEELHNFLTIGFNVVADRCTWSNSGQCKNL